MARQSIELIMRLADACDEYERQNTELKRRYIVDHNIMPFVEMAKTLPETKAVFGTGYPYYVLKNDLSGNLPVIDEQIRYDGELRSSVEDYRAKLGLPKGDYSAELLCADCLDVNGVAMPDLKVMCKPCPWVSAGLRPREWMKRVADNDEWIVCKDEDIGVMKYQVKKVLADYGFETSDIDPVKAIFDFCDIVSVLQGGGTPNKKVAIDAHLVGYNNLNQLISRVPDVLDFCHKHDQVPYLPIHPWSLRKEWQKDDNAYNYILDFLNSFTLLMSDPRLTQLTNDVRKYVANKYDFDQIHKWVLETGGAGLQRRFQTPHLVETLRERIEGWREM